jgi:8-oxo-dGTP pyrophosphatase MutT (NUDIX family)
VSFLDRIQAVNSHDWRGFRVFQVEGIRVGFVKHAFAEILARWPEVFKVTDTDVSLAAELATPQARSAAVQEVLLTLRDQGLIRGWRGELYPVNRYLAESPFLLMERAAVPFFGVCAYGVHLNGYVRHRGEIQMWIGRRSLVTFSEPGKLDQLVAGGQPAGMSLKVNLIKECWEEAGIPREIASRARSVGAVSYCWEIPQGLRSDVIFNFDLQLPRDFTPVNRDREMEEFYLWPMDKVIATVHDTNAFKFNCALVVIDFLIRHGLIPPEHPDYLEILHGLLSRQRAIEEYPRCLGLAA